MKNHLVVKSIVTIAVLGTLSIVACKGTKTSTTGPSTSSPQAEPTKAPPTNTTAPSGANNVAGRPDIISVFCGKLPSASAHQSSGGFQSMLQNAVDGARNPNVTSDNRVVNVAGFYTSIIKALDGQGVCAVEFIDFGDGSPGHKVNGTIYLTDNDLNCTANGQACNYHESYTLIDPQGFQIFRQNSKDVSKGQFPAPPPTLTQKDPACLQNLAPSKALYCSNGAGTFGSSMLSAITQVINDELKNNTKILDLDPTHAVPGANGLTYYKVLDPTKYEQALIAKLHQMTGPDFSGADQPLCAYQLIDNGTPGPNIGIKASNDKMERYNVVQASVESRPGEQFVTYNPVESCHDADF